MLLQLAVPPPPRVAELLLGWHLSPRPASLPSRSGGTLPPRCWQSRTLQGDIWARSVQRSASRTAWECPCSKVRVPGAALPRAQGAHSCPRSPPAPLSSQQLGWHLGKGRGGPAASRAARGEVLAEGGDVAAVQAERWLARAGSWHGARAALGLNLCKAAAAKRSTHSEQLRACCRSFLAGLEPRNK